MYPNPQDALPLPLRPSVEHYHKLAKDLVKACRSGEPAAIGDWALRWLRNLAALRPDAIWLVRETESRAEQVAAYAREQLAPGASGCALTAAQFVIARAQGFLSWPKFMHHVEALVEEGSNISAFEAGANAVVAGDLARLESLLRQYRGLVRETSLREHRATLLHYVSANGVENYRQVSPPNAVAVATMLLDAGAEVDATAEVYHGQCTTLGLVATSAPPAQAGVQLPLIELLLARGAKMEQPGMAGNRHALVHACLANGQPEAAELLAARGAPLDFPGAAGLGDVEALDRLASSITPPQATLEEAFALAAGYGRTAAVAWFLDRGFAVDTILRLHGEGHTGLHVASYHAHPDTVELLLARGARVDITDRTWGTPPLIWALTGWTQKVGVNPERFHAVVARLVAAGAEVTGELLAWPKLAEDPDMVAALTGKRGK